MNKNGHEKPSNLIECACGFADVDPSIFRDHLREPTDKCKPIGSYVELGNAAQRAMQGVMDEARARITKCEFKIQAWQSIIAFNYQESLERIAEKRRAEGGVCVKCGEATKSQWLGRWQCPSHTIIKVGRNAVKPDDARFKGKDGKESQSVSEILANVLAEL